MFDDDELRASSILDALDDGFVALDAEQRIVAFNAAAERILRVAAREVVGERLDRFLPPEERVAHVARVAGFRPGTSARPMSATGRLIHAVRGDGSRVALSVRIGAARYGAGYVHFAVIRDLTERHALEERARSLAGQLEHSQRFEALGQLAGGLAHEVNNALAIVLANVELLESNEHEVAAIGEAARHAAGVVRQLLTFARGSAEPVSDCDLVAETRRALELLRATLPVAVRVTFELPERAVPVALSRQELRQVLFNLLTNAAHAMNEAGRVHISTSLDDERVTLCIADDGPGIDPKVGERLFEPFVSTKPTSRGSGLGLSVVHGIVGRRGGSIRLVDSPLGGAAFEILLRPGDLAPARPAPRAAPALSGRVLILDDQKTLARALGRLLRARGLEVTVLHRVADARTRLAAQPHDVLLTDQSMPEGTGLELVRELRAAGNGMACAILTGSPDLQLERETRELACAFASKPIDQEGLIELLQRAIVLAPA